MRSLEKREKILLAVLVPVIIYFLFDQGYLSGWTGPSEAKVAAIILDQAQNPQNEFEKYTQVVLGSAIASNQGWKNDPFFYVNDEESGAGEIYVDKLFGKKPQNNPRGFALDGISWMGNSGIAIINGNMLKEGDKIKGYVVHKIAVKQVTLKLGTQTLRLTINE